MCDNDKMHSFDANLSVVSSYIDDLKGHPDGDRRGTDPNGVV